MLPHCSEPFQEGAHMALVKHAAASLLGLNRGAMGGRYGWAT
jgi:hypothetical protein